MKAINFMGKKKFIYIFSIFMILASLLSLGIKGFNLGTDFSGGTLLELKFEQTVTSEQIDAIIPGAQVQKMAENTFSIRTKTLSQEEFNKIEAQIQTDLGKVEVLKNDTVSGVVGNELTKNAALALILAGLIIVIYLSLRFELAFGLGGIFSLFHDIIIVLGIFSFFQLEIGMSFIAALLTIVGYSINDTIVIYDRIRENLKVPALSKESKASIVNISVTQTLGRSISTAVCVLLVLLSLYFLGGSSTKEFTLAMIIGTVFGAYSSIAVASPLWIDISNGIKKIKDHRKNSKQVKNK